jgi:hypothetical protein
MATEPFKALHRGEPPRVKSLERLAHVFNMQD